MQALAQQRLSSRSLCAAFQARAPPARVVCARATPVQRSPSHDEGSKGNRFLAVSLSALLAFQLGAAPLITPPPSQAALSSEEIKERNQRREELRRLAREKAENQKTEAIPCVTIGCYADSEEAAATRKRQAEERKEEVRRQAQIAYEQERERNERNFKAVAAKSSFTGEQESVLKERQKESARESAERATPGEQEPAKEPPVKALMGAGIFGSSGDE